MAAQKTLVWLLIVACSCGDDGAARPPGDGADASATAPDGSRAADGSAAFSCQGGCPSGQYCAASGTCMTLLAQCPCPSGSYCDLASNHCRAGCSGDADCPSSEFCHPSHQCVAGCRDAAGCSQANECQTAACDHGQCVYTGARDGLMCQDDGNPCTDDLCQSGACTHPPTASGTSCGTGMSCVQGSCRSGCWNGSTTVSEGQACSATTTCCGGSCIPTTGDAQNCGGCGIVCPSNRAACCSGVCRDVSSDNLNCGGCGLGCGSNTCCRGVCTNTQSDLANCGYCGHACNGTGDCHSGSCCVLLGQDCLGKSCCGGYSCSGNGQGGGPYTCQ